MSLWRFTIFHRMGGEAQLPFTCCAASTSGFASALIGSATLIWSCPRANSCGSRHASTDVRARHEYPVRDDAPRSASGGRSFYFLLTVSLLHCESHGAEPDSTLPGSGVPLLGGAAQAVPPSRAEGCGGRTLPAGRRERACVPLFDKLRRGDRARGRVCRPGARARTGLAFGPNVPSRPAPYLRLECAASSRRLAATKAFSTALILV